MAIALPEQLHEALHDAALDPARWAEALGAVAAFVAGDGACALGALSLVEAPGNPWLLASADEHERTYPLEELARHPLFRGALDLPQGFVGPSGRFADPAALAQSTLARTHLRDGGTVHGVSAVIDSSAGRTVVLHVLGRRSDGTWTAGAEDRMRALAGTVRRAAEVHMALRRARANAWVSEELLDRLDLATFVLDSGGTLVRSNHAARALLARAEGLREDGGRLVYEYARPDDALAAALATVFDGTAPSGGEVVIVPRVEKRPLLAFVSALRRAGSDGLLAAVLIRDADVHGPHAEEMLREVFLLTAREARLAVAIADGHSPEQAAALLGMTVGTARTHLKRVFYKTATTRQADIVRLVLGEFPPLRDPSV